MLTPKEKLSRLLELAAQGPEQRAALAGEVAGLLLEWPAEYPDAMRTTFTSLLEKIVREMDEDAQTALALRLDKRDDFPLSLLNELFLAAPAEMKDALLARNSAVCCLQPITIEADAMLSAARNSADFSVALAGMLAIPLFTAARIVADRSGRALAVVCRGTGINRATFSGIAILAGPVKAVHQNFAMLSVFDRVPHNGAANLVAFWRSRLDPFAPLIKRAA